MGSLVYGVGMDTRTRNDIGPVLAPTLNIAHRVLAHLEMIGHPLPNHPDTGYPVIWGVGSSSEHATKRALDLMVTANPEIGVLISEYLWDRRNEFGLIHIIFRQHIRSTRVDPGVNRLMPDRGTPTENHMDHVHAFFDGRTVSRGTDSPKVELPKPPKRPIGVPKFPLPKGHYFGPESGPVSSVSGYHGNRGHLARWQRRMIERGWGLGRYGADGRYGDDTRRVARAFQTEKGLHVDGLIGAMTWRAAWIEDVT